MSPADRLKALLIGARLEGESVIRVLVTDDARSALRALNYKVDITQYAEPVDRGWSHPVRGGLVCLWRHDEFERMQVPVVEV